jgi:hypothetical protein
LCCVPCCVKLEAQLLVPCRCSMSLSANELPPRRSPGRIRSDLSYMRPKRLDETRGIGVLSPTRIRDKLFSCSIEAYFRSYSYPIFSIILVEVLPQVVGRGISQQQCRHNQRSREPGQYCPLCACVPKHRTLKNNDLSRAPVAKHNIYILFGHIADNTPCKAPTNHARDSDNPWLAPKGVFPLGKPSLAPTKTEAPSCKGK